MFVNDNDVVVIVVGDDDGLDALLHVRPPILVLGAPRSADGTSPHITGSQELGFLDSGPQVGSGEPLKRGVDMALQAAPHLLNGIQFWMAGRQTNHFVAPLANHVVLDVMWRGLVRLAEQEQFRPRGTGWDRDAALDQPVVEVGLRHPVSMDPWNVSFRCMPFILVNYNI